MAGAMKRIGFRTAVLGGGLVVATALPLPCSAQVNSTPQPYIDLGPSARPTGVPPNSGLQPGTPARPPGEYGAGSYSPVNPLPNTRPAPPVVPRYPARVDPNLPPRAGKRPPALPRSTQFCRDNPKNTRCRGGG